MNNAFKKLCARALKDVAALHRGDIAWREALLRFPDDEEYEDEDLSELLDLVEHEPSRGIFPSSKRDRRRWENQVQQLIDRLTARIGTPNSDID